MHIIICVQLCAAVCSELMKPVTRTSVAGAGQNMVEESLTNSASNGNISCYLEAINFINEVKHRKKAYL